MRAVGNFLLTLRRNLRGLEEGAVYALTSSSQWTSFASKQKLIDALVARAAWLHANQPPEWENTPTGITPVKKVSASGRSCLSRVGVFRDLRYRAKVRSQFIKRSKWQ